MGRDRHRNARQMAESATILAVQLLNHSALRALQSAFQTGLHLEAARELDASCVFDVSLARRDSDDFGGRAL
jgi:hypothetical protein